MSKDLQDKDRMIAELEGHLQTQKDSFNHMLSADSDKRMLFEIEQKNKVLEDQYKAIYTEVVALRKDNKHKDFDLDRAQTKAA
jgi:hypothetical protein